MWNKTEEVCISAEVKIIWGEGSKSHVHEIIYERGLCLLNRYNLLPSERIYINYIIGYLQNHSKFHEVNES